MPQNSARPFDRDADDEKPLPEGTLIQSSVPPVVPPPDTVAPLGNSADTTLPHPRVVEESGIGPALIDESMSGDNMRGSGTGTMVQGAQNLPANLGKSTKAYRPTSDSSQTQQQVGGMSSSAIERQTKFPIVPGYEIERELGRGGMGVVYLAKQGGLKRYVALKMIRNGTGAGDDELERFRVEAEAVAALQHPNIVQIYEIGQFDAMPFCALEFVSGGSLSERLDGQRWAPKPAANLVEILARAMGYAHQQGIVHRDLKPANILIHQADAGRMTPGSNADTAKDSGSGSAGRAGGKLVPKITDFGLAKRLDGEDSGLTRTGAVMGTPSYMAPEQAAGNVKELGPAADTYALGVILYELMTGRVPFSGRNIMETLGQVVNVEPPPPSSLVPGLPRDLETICLKCLQKSPDARYATATDFADDLARFQAGEPILARRATIGQKLTRFVRKRAPVLAAVLLVVVLGSTAVWFAMKSGTDRQTTQLLQEFDAALLAPTWTAEQRENLDSLIEKLRLQNPTAGEAANQKAIEQSADRVQQIVGSARVEADDVALATTELAWLRQHDPARAAQLQTALALRSRAWQTTLELRPPFANAADALGIGGLIVQPDSLSIPPRDASQPIVLTKLGSPSPARLEVRFAPGWDASGAIELFLNSTDLETKLGYGFAIIADPQILLEPGTARTFSTVNGNAQLKLSRNGVTLAQQAVQVPPGPLKLLAERVGNRLRVQVGDLPALEFDDILPLSVRADQRIALRWPAKVSLTGLQLQTQQLPPNASPLERADDLFDREQFADARVQYQEQARTSTDRNLIQEAEYKQSTCLIALKRDDDGATMLETLVSSEGDRWPVLAATQLWQLRLRQKQFTEADAIFTIVASKYTPQQLAQYVPKSMRQEIFGQNTVPTPSYMTVDPKTIVQIESIGKLAKLLGEQEIENDAIFNRPIFLLMNRQTDDAIVAARVALANVADASAKAPSGKEQYAWMLKWLCWSLRQQKRFGECQEVINQTLNQYRHREVPDSPWNSGDRSWFKNAWLPAYLEQARLCADLKQWDQAANALTTYDRDRNRPMENFAFYGQAYLMWGFCRDAQGDPQGALKLWNQGLFSKFIAEMPEATRPNLRSPPNSRNAMIDYWLLMSLTDTLGETEAADLTAALVGQLGGDALSQQLLSSAQLTPKLLNGVWRSPRGRETARKLAFAQYHPADHYRIAPKMVCYEKLRQDLFAGKPTPEQDDLIWQTANSFGDDFLASKLTRGQAIQLTLAWKGSSGLLGWGGVAPSLSPNQRAMFAYILGFRYRILGKPADATKFFRTAAESTNPTVKTLAQKELDSSPPK